MTTSPDGGIPPLVLKSLAVSKRQTKDDWTAEDHRDLIKLHNNYVVLRNAMLYIRDEIQRRKRMGCSNHQTMVGEVEEMLNGLERQKIL